MVLVRINAQWTKIVQTLDISKAFLSGGFFAKLWRERIDYEKPIIKRDSLIVKDVDEIPGVVINLCCHLKLVGEFVGNR